MRLDKFLKVSRLVKRREVAKELCDDGDVLINGKVGKPSSEVVPGDKLILCLGRHTVTAEVLETRPFANKDQAGELYRILSDEVKERTDENVQLHH